MANNKTLRFAFFNMDFATKQAKDQLIVDWLLKTYPGVVFFAAVETKVDTFAKMFSTTMWHVLQNVKNSGKRNVAAAWRRGVFRNPTLPGLSIGANPNGHKMLPRWLRIIDVDLWVDKQNRWQRCRLIIGHRPPKRFKVLWPIFDAHVKLCIKAAKWSRRGHWAFFSDENQAIATVAKKYGGKAHGEGIDGVTTGPRMTVVNLVIARVPKQKGWTDHVGIIGTLEVIS